MINWNILKRAPIFYCFSYLRINQLFWIKWFFLSYCIYIQFKHHFYVFISITGLLLESLAHLIKNIFTKYMLSLWQNEFYNLVFDCIIKYHYFAFHIYSSNQDSTVWIIHDRCEDTLVYTPGKLSSPHLPNDVIPTTIYFPDSSFKWRTGPPLSPC